MTLIGLSGAASAKTIGAKALDDHECNDEQWHFVINQVRAEADAPASINVTWDNGSQANVTLDRFTGQVAHYTTTLNLDANVTNATAEIYDEWDGQFNLSDGPCEAQEDREITIRVMKHECDPALVTDIEDFETVDTNGNGVHEFVDTVLACPTIVMPGDEQSNGALVFDVKKQFAFEVEGDDGEIQTMENTTYEKRQLCESAEASQDEDAFTGVIGADVSNDGDMDDCLDTSLYRFDGVSDGDVSVTETQPPNNTRPGALEFTPQAVNPNNDADSLEEGLREVFEDDSTIELDTTQDEDGMITLHVYNFPEQVPPTDVPCPTVTATADSGPNNHLEWTEVANASAYNIYRATGEGGFSLLATVDNETLAHDDGDVEVGQTYRYTVTAIVDDQESVGCNVAEVTAIPVFPSAIAAASAAVLGVGAYAIHRRD